MMKNDKFKTVKKLTCVVIGTTAAAAICVTGVVVMANNWHKVLEANGLPDDIYDPTQD